MIEVIAECVTGNHERCKNPTVCVGSRRPWIYRYLNKNTKLSCTSQDMQILHGCIRYRLNENKSAKWHCGRHTLICKKNSN